MARYVKEIFPQSNTVRFYPHSYLKLVTKYFAESKKSKQSWKRPENFNIYFCVSFDNYFQKLNLEGH